MSEWLLFEQKKSNLSTIKFVWMNEFWLKGPCQAHQSFLIILPAQRGRRTPLSYPPLGRAHAVRTASSPRLLNLRRLSCVCAADTLSLCYNGLSLPFRMGMCAFISVRLSQRGLCLFFSRSRSGLVCVSQSEETPRWSRVIWCCVVWVCCVMLRFYLHPRGADVIDAVGCGGMSDVDVGCFGTNR